MKAPQQAGGFTLLELMITLLVIAIVASIAVPSMRNMIVNSSAKRITGLFELDLEFARSHAITRGETVRLSPRDGDIVNGWQVIAETTNDLLRERGSLDSNVTITSSAGLSSIAFTPTGQIETAGTVTIRTSGCTGDEDKSISLLTSGQIAVTELTCITY